MIGVVPAAGKGTRLRPLTEDKPKGLVDVGGKPLLEHVFNTLLDSGVDELIVVVGYQVGAIANRFGGSFECCPITYVPQRDRLGLGHALKQSEPFIDELFAVLNDDNGVKGTSHNQNVGINLIQIHQPALVSLISRPAFALPS